MNTEKTPPPEGLAAASGSVVLSDRDRTELAEILSRRANEIASFKTDLENRAAEAFGKTIRFYEFPGSVELALSREISRLRKLADKIAVPKPPEDDDE